MKPDYQDPKKTKQESGKVDPEFDSFMEPEITSIVPFLGREIARKWLFLGNKLPNDSNSLLRPELAKWSTDPFAKHSGP
jgi:hypothetical protein